MRGFSWVTGFKGGRMRQRGWYLPPSDQSPSDQAPSDQSPSDQSPSDQIPRDQSPSDQIPSDQTPSDQTPSDQTPSYQTPSDQTASDQNPSEHTPRDQPPSDQTVNTLPASGEESPCISVGGGGSTAYCGRGVAVYHARRHVDTEADTRAACASPRRARCVLASKRITTPRT